MKMRMMVLIALVLGFFCLFAATSGLAIEKGAGKGIMTEESDMPAGMESLGTEEYESIEDEPMDVETAPEEGYMQEDETWSDDEEIKWDDDEEDYNETEVESTDDEDMGDE